LPRVKHGGSEHVVGFGLALSDIHVPPNRRLLAQARTCRGVVPTLDQPCVVEREALRNPRDRNAWRHDRDAETPALPERRRRHHAAPDRWVRLLERPRPELRQRELIVLAVIREGRLRPCARE